MDIKALVTEIFDRHEVWEISISSRPEIIDEIADLVESLMAVAYDEGFEKVAPEPKPM